MGFCEENKALIGTIESVDTSVVIVRATNEDLLTRVQVNSLVHLESIKVGQSYIGLVAKLIRKSAVSSPFDDSEDEEDAYELAYDSCLKIILIGTYYEKVGVHKNVFKRSLKSIPTINSQCHLVEGRELKEFMQSIVENSQNGGASVLSLGVYAIDANAKAYLDANRFFQRHAVIVGSTGSGKSWCVARVLEQVAQLESSNAILFDIHGEYKTLDSAGFSHYKIAGPNDSVDERNLFLPYWLLGYEEILSMILDRSDSNAPNQAMNFTRKVLELKSAWVRKPENEALRDIEITIDSPVPYDFDQLVRELKGMDEEMVLGSKGKPVKGSFNGLLTRFILRLQAKLSDKRLNFMFKQDAALQTNTYLASLLKKLTHPAVNGEKGVKIIDFSEVPSDVLPLIVSLIARLIFSLQQWTQDEKRHPIALFCDEAHLYIPATASSSTGALGLQNFERIAKEGRKYGVSLVTISQRPSEVNKTALSQSSNFIAMRLSNSDDRRVIKDALPDTLGNYVDMLPTLDVGEAIVVGDASLLPSRIEVTAPNHKPLSSTVDFWDEWAKSDASPDLDAAILSMLRQSKH